MNTVDYILENVDPMRILSYYNFRNVKEMDTQIRASCEIHKGNNPTAFVWNKSNNLWYCYTGDCHGGDVFNLVQIMDGIGFTESVKRVADILGIDITEMKIERQPDIVLRDTKKWLEFMKHYHKRTVSLTSYDMPYTKYRDTDESFDRFDVETLQFYGAKFCNVFPTEHGLLYHKLVIPIEYDNALLGVALRDMTGRSHAKWLFQPKGLEINRILYNYDRAIDSVKQHGNNQLILTEGIFDVWAFHKIGLDNAVAIFGSQLKKEQANILLRSGLDLILAFDGDEHGDKCTEKVIEFFRCKSDIEIIRLPRGFDPADCQPEELRTLYLQRQ